MEIPANPDFLETSSRAAQKYRRKPNRRPPPISTETPRPTRSRASRGGVTVTFDAPAQRHEKFQNVAPGKRCFDAER